MEVKMSDSKLVGIIDETIEGDTGSIKIEKYFSIEQNRKDSIAWLCEAVIIFEKILIDLARDYEKDTGKKLKSAKGYAG